MPPSLRLSILSLWATLLLGGLARLEAAPPTELIVDPAVVHLHGPQARFSLLVTGVAGGQRVDLTRKARYVAERPDIVGVDARGVLTGFKDGVTQVKVTMEGITRSVQVQVRGSGESRSFHFENDIVPLLSRFGCNSSGCHGNAEGQNGFKLSIFGSDPAADHAALVKEARGRRILPSAPEQSLLLRKAAGTMAHGGGSRIPPGSMEYATLRDWIAAGAPVGPADAPQVASVRVEPRERILAPGATQQLRVVATYTDGRKVDVTRHGRFQSNQEGLAEVDADGLVTAGSTPGTAAVLAAFMNQVDTFRAVLPRAETIASYPKLPENNFIDTLVHRHLRKLNLLPSDLCDDAAFLRRAYLDILGTLPTTEESRRFLADRRPERRALLVDHLLERPEFAEYWALRWSDLLRVDRAALGHKRAYGYYRWIRDSLAANMPLDRFAREVVAAEGLVDETGPAAFYKVVKKPGEMASTLAQVFLGVRIACAECHHHPFDRWSQTDYHGMQAYFNAVQVGASGRGEMVFGKGAAEARHPRTGAKVPANPLGERPPEKVEAGDRRAELAAWMTAPENPWFARNLANRTWAHFLGRGLIEPVDDLRATNPPSNPELLEALADHLRKNRFDFRALIRTITASRTYQTSSKPNVTNARDESNHSRALFRRIDAEVLLDMISRVTGMEERFEGMPPGTRAIGLWDSKVEHYFLKLFGRPIRASACECERNHEPGVAQVLHLLNSPKIEGKLRHDGGTVARLDRTLPKDGDLVDELYLLCFCRMPEEAERSAAVRFLQRRPEARRQAAEDLTWSLMNSLEFLFNH